MFTSLLHAFLNLFRPIRTHSYPAQDIELPAGYRGLIEHNHDACIYCDKCEKVCPPKAIIFKQNADGTKTYNYNAWLCIYCGECVRACPKPDEALWQSETKQLPALKKDGVNSEWSVYELACKQSRQEYADAKKAAKNQKKE